MSTSSAGGWAVPRSRRLDSAVLLLAADSEPASRLLSREPILSSPAALRCLLLSKLLSGRGHFSLHLSRRSFLLFFRRPAPRPASLSPTIAALRSASAPLPAPAAFLVDFSVCEFRVDFASSRVLRHRLAPRRGPRRPPLRRAPLLRAGASRHLLRRDLRAIPEAPRPLQPRHPAPQRAVLGGNGPAAHPAPGGVTSAELPGAEGNPRGRGGSRERASPCR